ncbi:predicted protein [Histoplasma capsulatum var. duboisii H88]|uniref:Predicted protein n=1 Tax=Ajellomyces capsulatus (strain H88) TaxID=544711 RepID=F0ULU4_AJEC8|nr:predicted protein [Histoplasma capsulatum var. duboisii H88]
MTGTLKDIQICIRTWDMGMRRRPLPGAIGAIGAIGGRSGGTESNWGPKQRWDGESKDAETKDAATKTRGNPREGNQEKTRSSRSSSRSSRRDTPQKRTGPEDDGGVYSVSPGLVSNDNEGILVVNLTSSWANSWANGSWSRTRRFDAFETAHQTIDQATSISRAGLYLPPVFYDAAHISAIDASEAIGLWVLSSVAGNHYAGENGKCGFKIKSKSPLPPP